MMDRHILPSECATCVAMPPDCSVSEMSALERGLLTALWAVLSFVFPTIFPAHAYADDSSVGVILPGLRSDPVGER
jgi:hypothetical protein